MNITNILSGRKILSLAKEVFHFANFVKCWIPIYQKNNINISMELQYLEKWNARIQTAWVGSDHSNASSFYRPQNVLGWSKFFLPDKKNYLHIVAAVTNILFKTKRWFSFSKIGFCASTKVFEEALNTVKYFGLAQNIWTSTKHFGTCKRTRH